MRPFEQALPVYSRYVIEGWSEIFMLKPFGYKHIAFLTIAASTCWRTIVVAVTAAL